MQMSMQLQTAFLTILTQELLGQVVTPLKKSEIKQIVVHAGHSVQLKP